MRRPYDPRRNFRPEKETHHMSTKMKCLPIASALLWLSCSPGGSAPTPAPGGIGAQAADVVSDTAVLKEAQGAANELVRNAQDCDAVKASLAEVNRKLDEAAKHVRTTTGQVTLAAVKSRVAGIAQACP
jgi:hypothetical protein